MLELYHNDMSVCAAKVRIALAEKRLEWRGHHLDLRAGDALTPGYLKLNPVGVVPTLVHEGRVVIESNVICEYLEDAFAERPLRPADPLERARMRLWTKQLDEGVHAATGTISMCIAFRMQYLSKTPEEIRAHLARVPAADRRERQRLGIELGMDSPQFEPALRRYAKLLDDMAAALAGNPWLAGASFSLADIAYMPYMARLDHLGLGGLVDTRPGMRAWVARLRARTSWEDGLAQWFNPKYLEIFAGQAPAARARLQAILG